MSIVCVRSEAYLEKRIYVGGGTLWSPTLARDPDVLAPLARQKRSDPESKPIKRKKIEDYLPLMCSTYFSLDIVSDLVHT